MKLTFWGAAGEVTGSMHLVESGGRRFCWIAGCNQGRRKDADRKNRNLPFPGSSIDAVVLSHAHIDHSGNLPTLVKNGFSGPDFFHSGHHRSVPLDAARHRPHPGKGRRVPQQAARAPQVHGPGTAV
jgi:predicted metal-dependent RNase